METTAGELNLTLALTRFLWVGNMSLGISHCIVQNHIVQKPIIGRLGQSIQSFNR